MSEHQYHVREGAVLKVGEITVEVIQGDFIIRTATFLDGQSDNRIGPNQPIEWLISSPAADKPNK